MVLNIKIWGPAVWYTMHKIAFSMPMTDNELPDNQRNQLITFYRSLSNLLPCKHCRIHYKNILQNNSIQNNVISGKKLSKWTVRVHNIVNRNLHKAVVGYPTALSIYNNKRINHSKLQNYINFILVISDKFPLNYRKSNASSLIHTYPCLKCRDKMINFLENNKLNSINNQNQMTVWSKKLLTISKKPC